MAELILFGTPILFIVLGAIGALSFSSFEEEERRELEAEASAEAKKQEVAAARSIAFSQSIDRANNDLVPVSDDISAEALIAEFEERLRKDRLAADRHLANPTENSIWIN